MKTRTAYALSRAGQRTQPIKYRPAASPPVLPLGFDGRPERDWGVYNGQLGARFALSAVAGSLDPDIWLTGVRGGNRATFTDEAIIVLCKLAALLHLPLRGACGLLADYAASLGIDVEIPHYSTLCRRRRALNWVLPLAPGSVWAVDSTGLGVSGAGEYFNARFKCEAKTKYVKLHAVSDVTTGLIVAASVTVSAGKGTGDPSQAHVLLPRARGCFGALLGDGAYDGEPLRAACDAAGGRLIAPLPKNAVYSPGRPLRNEVKHQVGKLGDSEWRKRSGYTYRVLAETVFSVLKRCLGHRLNARSEAGREAEVMARIAVYNDWIMQTA